MHLETLRLFCDVVRHRSFSRGAAQNVVSQSAASQAMQQLEAELGVALLDRTKRPFVVTPEGQGVSEAWRRAGRPPPRPPQPPVRRAPGGAGVLRALPRAARIVGEGEGRDRRREG